MEKYFQEVCLLDQQYIKDSDKKISQLVEDIRIKVGENLVIRRFSRFRIGE